MTLLQFQTAAPYCIGGVVGLIGVCIVGELIFAAMGRRGIPMYNHNPGGTMDRSHGHIPIYILALVLAMNRPIFSPKEAPQRKPGKYRNGNTDYRRPVRFNRRPIRLDNRKHPSFRDRKEAA